MPTPPLIDRRDFYEGETIDFSRVKMSDPSRARTTISQRDITTTDVRDESLADLRRKIMEGLIDPEAVPDYLWDWLGLNKADFQIKEVNVAAEQQARKVAQQNAARVRIREVCCQ